MAHYLTPAELQRIVDNTPGHEHLAAVLSQLIHDNRATVRVDLDQLLRKPEQTAGALPQQ